jgi:hypothetical protein
MTISEALARSTAVRSWLPQPTLLRQKLSKNPPHPS